MGEFRAVEFENPAVTWVPGLNYSTTRNPWSVLFRRRPPSAVTVTMSSISTPNPSLDDEQELTDGPHARPAHTIADEVGAGAVLQCGRAY